jgi:hypothetical protein
LQTSPVVAPAVVEKDPGKQAMHDALEGLPAKELYVPGKQGMHVWLEFAPTRSENVPLGHCVHDAWPAASAKEPAAHGRQSAAAAEVAEAAANVPAAQTVPKHEPLPGVAVQVPGRQGMHATAVESSVFEPSGPALPAGQGTPTQLAAPVVVEYVPLRHSKHVAFALEVAPTWP